jgi:hypothetical protein
MQEFLTAVYESSIIAGGSDGCTAVAQTTATVNRPIIAAFATGRFMSSPLGLPKLGVVVIAIGRKLQPSFAQIQREAENHGQIRNSGIISRRRRRALE